MSMVKLNQTKGVALTVEEKQGLITQALKTCDVTERDGQIYNDITKHIWQHDVNCVDDLTGVDEAELNRMLAECPHPRIAKSIILNLKKILSLLPQEEVNTAEALDVDDSVSHVKFQPSVVNFKKTSLEPVEDNDFCDYGFLHQNFIPTEYINKKCFEGKKLGKFPNIDMYQCAIELNLIDVENDECHDDILATLKSAQEQANKKKSFCFKNFDRLIYTVSQIVSSLRAHKIWTEKVCNTYIHTLCKISISNKSTFTASSWDKAMRKRWVDMSATSLTMDEAFYLNDISNYPRDIVDEAIKKFEATKTKPQPVKIVTPAVQLPVKKSNTNQKTSNFYNYSNEWYKRPRTDYRSGYSSWK
jgi:hypothetical protein